MISALKKKKEKNKNKKSPNVLYERSMTKVNPFDQVFIFYLTF